MPRTLSKEAEDRIIAAVKQAVALVDDRGLLPDAAIEKVAREQKWGADMIRFASHAYNTGKQTAQREGSRTALEKFADFPLADPAKVIATIYPATVKSAADQELAVGVSTEYALPPTFVARHAERQQLTALRASAALEKAAAAPCPKCAKAPCACKQPTYTSVANQNERLKKTAEEARHQAAVAYDRLLGGLDKLATYFRQYPIDRVPFAAAETAATTYYGGAGAKLMDWVYQRNQLKEARAAGTKFAAALRVAPGLAPYSLIHSCIDLGRNVEAARSAEKRARDELDGHTREQLGPFVSAPVPQTAETSWSLSGLGADLEKDAGGPMSMVVPAAVGVSTKELLDKAMTGGQDKDERVNKAWEDMEDPAHDAQLRQIRTQTMLADLMNDEVIGGHDPETVLAKYNEIAQLAPRAAQQPIAMRTLLRRHLAGNAEPHEIQQVTDLEKGMLGTERDTPNTRILRDAPESILG